MYVKKISLNKLLNFITQINILLKLNYHFDSVLEILISQNQKNNEYILKINQLIKNGENISYSFEEMSKQNKHINKFFINLIKLGEETASLQSSFAVLEDYLSTIKNVKTNIINSSIYPCTILVTIILFVLLLIFYLIPNFEQFYSELNTKIPDATKKLVDFKKNFTAFFSNNIWMCVFILYFLIFFKKLYIAFIPIGIRNILIFHIDKLLLNTPIIGKIIKLFLSYKFLYIIFICLKNNISIINNCNNLTSNVYIQLQLNNFKNSIESGSSLKNSLKYCEFLPYNIKQIIFFENASDNLKCSLENAIRFTKLQLNEYLYKLQKLLEPLLTIFLTIFITIIIYLLYIPLLNINIY